MQNPPATNRYPTLEPRVSLGIHLDYNNNPARPSQIHPAPVPMYQHPGQQQSPHGQPTHPQPGQAQYHGPGQQPLGGHSYGPPQGPGQPGQPYPPQISANRPEMTAVHQQPYLPAPQGGPPQPYYQQQPPGPPQDYRNQPQQAPNTQQAAPRQRTAIACKYCRRRKIRCSGFENAADGRCNNCLRFNQECVFTPVSSQTQAFVPAQAVYGRRTGPHSGPPQLYGPYGQPLPPNQYQLPSPGHGPPMQQGYPPQGYGPPGYQPQGYPPQHYEQQAPPGQGQQGPAAGNRRRRDDEEPHTPTLPPPNPGPNSNLAGHEQQQQQQYVYPEQPTYAGSPATAQHPYPPAGQPYYQGQSQRTSPGSTYSYEQPRTSNSPHAGNNYYQAQPMQQAQGQAQPNQPGRTPPPGENGRNGLAIRDIVSESSHSKGERTAADSDMVSALNRTSRR